MKRFWLLAVLTLTVCAAVSAGQTYTYTDLVNRLVDLEGLATLPVQGETCAQWSSYERVSRYDETTGKYVAWDANGDWNGHIRAEGDSIIAAEINGPGCITRIWSARPEHGHVKIYLDDNPTPVVDLPFADLFNGKNAPFNYSALVYERSLGWNCFVPIPFQKSCKVVLDKGWGAYYHFTYSTFPEGTQVPTFSRNLAATDLAALNKVDRFLRKQVGTDPASKRSGETIAFKSVNLSAGEKAVVANLNGPQAITGMWVRTDASEKVLREVSLQISWDGEKNPSIWSPLGDFFGTGPGRNEYKGLPLGITKEGLYSYWYMPFASGAKVEIRNDGNETFAGHFTLTCAPLTKSIESLGRFHAKWHRDVFLPKEPERWIDWPIVKATGRGRFVGVALEIWNPRGNWWGEGDEKFFVDGEKLPSTFGTGSEDYFGYAWCDPRPFYHAFHNQPRNDGDNVGHISVNRFQITENVPFQKSFDGDIEKYFLNERPTLYASTVYWYLEAGGGDPYGSVPVEARTFYVKPKVVKTPGAIEGESLKVLNKTGGNTSPQGMEVFIGGKWSGDSHLWWTNTKIGDKLDLAIPVKKSGKYEIKVVLTRAGDYGIVQLSLDGQKLGNPIDLHNDGVVASGEISLGMFNLSSGDHKLSTEIVGKNAKSSGTLFGLDYVKLAAK